MQSDEAEHFYDRVARRLAAYSKADESRLTPVVHEPNPEDRFRDIVKGGVGPRDVVLDIGAGDGHWLLDQVSPLVSKAIGLDDGAVRLQNAAAASRARNTGFVLADARHIPLSDECVSVVISRRGPLTADDDFLAEGCRILRPGGLVFVIDIGEQNAREVDEAFGRGQMLADRRLGPRLDRLRAMLERHRIEPTLTEDLLSFEHYVSREAIEFKLLTTPIVEDFDPVSDAAHLDALVARQAGSGGLKLTFHRLIIAGRKVR